MSLFADLLNLFFPPLCVCCQARLTSEEESICLSCLNHLPKTGYHEIENNKIEELFSGRLPFVQIASFSHFVKDGSVQKLIHELKYKNNPELGILMGKLCGTAIRGTSFIENVDCLIPVPLHPNREKARGYNQATQIAEGISMKTGIPLMKDILIRTIDNPSQTKQSRYERWENTEGVFDVSAANLLDNKHILLVDDVVTTGSTLESCGKALLEKNENLKISIYCFGAASG